MQNFHFYGRKEKGAYTPFTAPYFAFVRLGRVVLLGYRLFGTRGAFCSCFGRGKIRSLFLFLLYAVSCLKTGKVF